MEMDEKTGKPKKKQPEPPSELQIKDYRKLAENLRQEIDEQAGGAQRRKENTTKDEIKLEEDFRVLEADEAAAAERLARQKEAIEKFKQTECADDEVELARMKGVREELEKEEAVLVKKEKILEESRKAGTGGGGRRTTRRK